MPLAFRLLIAAVVCVCQSANAQVDRNVIESFLLGRVTTPTFDVGYQATIGPQATTNGQPTWFSAKTIVSGGQTSYQVDSLLFHGDAVQYKTYKSLAEFKISKVVFSKDSVEVKAELTLNPKLHANIRFSLPVGWQQNTTTEKLLTYLRAELPTSAEFSKLEQEVEAKRQADAEHLRTEAEQARLAERARQEAANETRRVESEKYIDTILLKKARAGDAEAEYQLGRIYFRGLDGVSKDEAQALSWFQKSAEQGNANGENGLGVMLQDGIGGANKDYQKSLILFRQSAIQNNPLGEYHLGYAYYRGLGIPPDLTQAITWFRKAAAQGDPDAQCMLGYFYQTGEGIKRDDAQAVLWYRKSSNQGNATAKSNLALIEHPQPVTDQDAFDLFSRAVNAVSGGLMSDHPYNHLQAELQAYYRNAGDDQHRALAVAFVGMGGAGIAEQAGRETIRSYDSFYERLCECTNYIPDESVKKRIVEKYANQPNRTGLSDTALAHRIATDANTLLEGMRSHHIGLSEYMTHVYLLYNGPRKNDPWVTANQQAISYLDIEN